MKIGVLGLGDMGKMLAIHWSNAGFQVFGSDLEANYASLLASDLAKMVSIYADVKDYVNEIDLLMIAIETENIDSTVKYLSSVLKKNIIITAQTSVKTPEINAFDTYIGAKAQIVGSHALFGPKVDPNGQIVAVFRHKSTNEAFESVCTAYKAIGCKVQELHDYKEHDKLMADVQVVTHVGFESIGSAFMHQKTFPWENSESKLAGLDNIKILLTLRIYSYKAHVYAGMAFQNPYAAKDVRTFATEQKTLFGYMISENFNSFNMSVRKARDSFFKNHESDLLLNDNLLEEFTLNPGKDHLPNSHLSLLSMLCTWDKIGVNPYENLICQTPPFKLRVGLVEYLCRNEDLFNETIETAVYNKSNREDDLAYHTAVHEWSNILEIGDQNTYYKHFNNTKAFLSPRLSEGLELSNKLISKIS